jgi:hypothetical protein
VFAGQVSARGVPHKVWLKDISKCAQGQWQTYQKQKTVDLLLAILQRPMAVV